MVVTGGNTVSNSLDAVPRDTLGDGGKDQPASSFVVSMVTRAVFGLLTVGMKSRGPRSPFPICSHLLLTSLKARVAKDALTC